MIFSSGFVAVGLAYAVNGMPSYGDTSATVALLQVGVPLLVMGAGFALHFEYTRRKAKATVQMDKAGYDRLWKQLVAVQSSRNEIDRLALWVREDITARLDGIGCVSGFVCSVLHTRTYIYVYIYMYKHI